VFAGERSPLCRVALCQGERRIPLVGRCLPCQGGSLVLATPDATSREDLLFFSLDDFPREDHLVELLVSRDEAQVSLRDAALATSALKEKNQELEASRERLESINTILEHEITAREEAEKQLARQHRELQQVLDSVVAQIWYLDTDGRVVNCNSVAREVSGVSLSETRGKTIHTLAPTWDDPERRHQESLAVARTGQPLLGSIQSFRAAEEVRWISVDKVPWRNADGTIVGVLLFIYDITSRKRVEEEVKESLSLLEATLDATADGILVVDVSGKIKGFNRQFQGIWGIPDAVLQKGNNEEAAAVAAQQVKDPDAFQAMRRRSGANVEAESFDTLELKDGRIVERYSRPQVIGNRVVGQVLSFRDVTERRLAEQRQAALLRKVADINEELSHFAYIVSHDLKAPLRGIQLVTEWLCADYGDKLGDEGKEQMALLQSRVNRMHNLIDGVLQYSRVGRIKEDMVKVDLKELMPIILDTIAPPAHIQITVEPNLPTVTCEKTRITQVFQNLLSNAVKFMDKPQGKIHVGCVEEGDFWKLSVTDNGPGIEEKHFERIFRIFQTLAPKDEYESTGVGLTLVKKIVELYGGRVWVESEVGKGSTFFFTFPRQKGSIE
jgi:two-component system sensor kinase FixL